MTRASQLTAHHRTLQNRMWGESCSYSRQSSQEMIPLSARKAGVLTGSASGDDVQVETELFDWVVAADALVDGGTTFEPAPRDRIIVLQADGKTAVYMVGNYGSERCWEPADSSGVELVIHTKLWSEAA